MQIFLKMLYRRLIAGALLACLLISLSPCGAPRAAEGKAAGITVENIYHMTLEKSQDGSVSLRYSAENGDSRESASLFPRRNASPAGTSAGSASLPSSFDLRDKKAVTSIKSQGYSGCCWAFATLKSLESNLIRTKGASPQLDLSENHLSWYLFHPSTDSSDPMYLDGIHFREDAAKSAYQQESSTIRNSYSYSSYYNALPYIQGGNALLGAFVLARWSGAVKESTAPFSASSTKALFSMSGAMAKKTNSLRYQSDFCLTDANCYDDASMDEIKTALMKSGALEASFYSDENNLTKNSDGTYGYFQKEKGAEEANHCIAIIGWDDNYSRKNFGRNAPSLDGAWLIANSYGTKYGQQGYFWLSYQEPSLGEIYGFEGTASSLYDNNYQYDGSGWGSTLVPKTNHPIKVANIFKAKKKYIQSLKAVGLYTVNPDQPYTIQIYRNVTAGNPSSGSLSATLTGTEKYRGYHTIPLPSPVSLRANESFSVVVTYHKTREDNGCIPIEGPPLTSSTLSINFHSSPGKSFCYSYASNPASGEKSYQWVDLNSTSIDTADGGSAKIYHNVCIKAFTVNTAPAGSITLKPSSEKAAIGVGEKLKLSSVVKQTSQKKVSYKSSKASVAKVTSKGVIKGKKKGSAVITAALPTGAADSIKITVKAAPKKIRTSPARKKTLRQGKSFYIRVKLPAGSASRSLTYTSSSPGKVKVNKQGKVTAKKRGSATITVKTYNGKKAKITIRVK